MSDNGHTIVTPDDATPEELEGIYEQIGNAIIALDLGPGHRYIWTVDRSPSRPGKFNIRLDRDPTFQ